MNVKIKSDPFEPDLDDALGWLDDAAEERESIVRDVVRADEEYGDLYTAADELNAVVLGIAEEDDEPDKAELITLVDKLNDALDRLGGSIRELGTYTSAEVDETDIEQARRVVQDVIDWQRRVELTA